MRMSFPRYLQMTAFKGGAVRGFAKLAILREVFLAGSLLKSELPQILARGAKRNAQILSKIKSMQDLSTLCDEACDELTLDHVLVGVA